MRRLAVLLAASLALVAPGSTSGVTGITVFAASSLTEVFPRIDPGPRFSFAGSDSLAVQIRNGAPADVFAAASTTQPNDLFRAGLVLKPRVFATNRLVLLVPRSNPAGIRSVFALRRSGIKLVIGQPKVPIGVYTRQVLKNLGLLDAALKNVVSEENDVKSIVAKVALGEADAGFAYVTDARAVSSKVAVVRIPSYAQPNVRYAIAVVKASKNKRAARAFVRRVLSKQGRRQLALAGFGAP